MKALRAGLTSRTRTRRTADWARSALSSARALCSPPRRSIRAFTTPWLSAAKAITVTQTAESMAKIRSTTSISTREIGRESGRERACQYVWTAEVDEHLQKKKQTQE